MQAISPYTILPSMKASQNNSQDFKADFSNMSPDEMENARKELYDEGKISLHQSMEIAAMDGFALSGVNGGKMVSGSSNMYTMINEMIDDEEKSGVNVKQNVESLQNLEKVLQKSDSKQNSSPSSGFGTILA